MLQASFMGQPKRVLVSSVSATKIFALLRILLRNITEDEYFLFLTIQHK